MALDGVSWVQRVPFLKDFESRLTSRSVSGQLDLDWQESGLVVTVRMGQHRLAR